MFKRVVSLSSICRPNNIMVRQKHVCLICFNSLHVISQMIRLRLQEISVRKKTQKNKNNFSCWCHIQKKRITFKRVFLLWNSSKHNYHVTMIWDLGLTLIETIKHRISHESLFILDLIHRRSIINLMRTSENILLSI